MKNCGRPVEGWDCERKGGKCVGVQRCLIDAEVREVRGFVWGAERSSVQANERSLRSLATQISSGKTSERKTEYLC